MHDKLMADQEHLDRDTFEKYARAMHLDMNRFARALGEDRVEQAIDSDVAAGTRLGVRGTPIFYINGKYLGGAQPLESFKAIIDDELDTARALVADGTPKARVYETLMKDAEPEAVYARGDGKPEDIFQGQIIITKTRLPLRFPSRAAFVKALEDERIYEIGANNESGWDIEYIAFFAAPLVQDSVELKFYDLTGGRSRYVAGDPQYPHDPNERMFVSSVGLSKSEFEAGKNYRMTLEADHKVIASTTLWLRDRPASPREPAAAR
jgi:hypothetical protein